MVPDVSEIGEKSGVCRDKQALGSRLHPYFKINFSRMAVSFPDGFFQKSAAVSAL